MVCRLLCCGLFCVDVGCVLAVDACCFRFVGLCALSARCLMSREFVVVRCLLLVAVCCEMVVSVRCVPFAVCCQCVVVRW